MRVPVLTALLCVTSAFPQTYSIRTLAGSYPLNDGGPATSAYLYSPTLLATDGQGNYFVVDQGRIRRFRVGATISTFAGPLHPGDSTRPTAVIPATFITGLGADSSGNVYYSDFNACVIRRITPAGEISIVAGVVNTCSTGADGPATSTAINRPYGITFDRQGRLIYSDNIGRRVRRIGADGRVTTVAGTGTNGYTGDGGPATAATLSAIEGLSIDRNGDLLIADTNNCVVRRVVDSTGVISTAANARLTGNQCSTAPRHAVADPVTNEIYSTDALLTALWFFPTGGAAPFPVLGSPGVTPAFVDGATNSASRVGRLQGMAFDADNNLVFVDTDNQRVRLLRRTVGGVNTVAGTSTFRGDGGPAAAANLFTPTQMATDATGNLFFIDFGHRRIRRIDTRGMMSTVAGSDSWALFSGEGLATETSLRTPSGLAIDSAGTMYISDTTDTALTKVSSGIRTVVRRGVYQQLAADPLATRVYAVTGNTVVAIDGTNSNLTAIAGNGTAGTPAAGADPRTTPLSPRALAAHPDGTLFVSDISGNIYRITNPGATDSAIRRLTGGAGTVNALSVAPGGASLLATDQGRVLRIDPTSGATTILAGATIGGFSGDGGPALDGRFALFPSGVAAGPDGEIYVSDTSNGRIRLLTPIRASSLAVNAGNNQSGAAGTALANPLRVIARDSNNAPLAGVEVTFAVTSGTATLGSRTAITGADGIASTTVQLGTTVGAVVITATAAPAAPVTFNLTITAPPAGGDLPRITAVIALSGYGGRAQMTSAGWFEIYGTNLTGGANARTWADTDFTAGVAPTALNGVRVTIGGQPAFVYFVSAGQVTVVAPDGLTIGSDAAIQVINSAGTSNSMSLPVVARSPGVLAPPVYKVNDRQYVVATFRDFSLSGPGELIPGTIRAKAGDPLQVFFVNGGAVSPALAAGRIVSALHTLPNVRLLLGTTEVPVAFAGYAPGFVGLFQLNFTVPNGMTGDQAFGLTVDGVAAQTGLYLAVE